MLKIIDRSQEEDPVVIKTAINKGFTLIELLVVIAIIAEPHKPTLTGF
jgi:prepilin-type N-terminal cleavage/methylation domain-containing protein